MAVDNTGRCVAYLIKWPASWAQPIWHARNTAAFCIALDFPSSIHSVRVVQASFFAKHFKGFGNRRTVCWCLNGRSISRILSCTALRSPTTITTISSGWSGAGAGEEKKIYSWTGCKQTTETTSAALDGLLKWVVLVHLCRVDHRARVTHPSFNRLGPAHFVFLQPTVCLIPPWPPCPCHSTLRPPVFTPRLRKSTQCSRRCLQSTQRALFRQQVDRKRQACLSGFIQQQEKVFEQGNFVYVSCPPLFLPQRGRWAAGEPTLGCSKQLCPSRKMCRPLSSSSCRRFLLRVHGDIQKHYWMTDPEAPNPFDLWLTNLR